MVYDVHFCYRIEPAARMAYNTETGESTAAYCKITLENVKRMPDNDEYIKYHVNYQHGLAEQMHIGPELVVPITYEEWTDNQDPDDEDCEDYEEEWDDA